MLDIRSFKQRQVEANDRPKVDLDGLIGLSDPGVCSRATFPNLLAMLFFGELTWIILLSGQDSAVCARAVRRANAQAFSRFSKNPFSPSASGSAGAPPEEFRCRATVRPRNPSVLKPVGSFDGDCLDGDFRDILLDSAQQFDRINSIYLQILSSDADVL